MRNVRSSLGSVLSHGPSSAFVLSNGLVGRNPQFRQGVCLAAHRANEAVGPYTGVRTRNHLISRSFTKEFPIILTLKEH